MLYLAQCLSLYSFTTSSCLFFFCSHSSFVLFLVLDFMLSSSLHICTSKFDIAALLTRSIKPWAEQRIMWSASTCLKIVFQRFNSHHSKEWDNSCQRMSLCLSLSSTHSLLIWKMICSVSDALSQAFWCVVDSIYCESDSSWKDRQKDSLLPNHIICLWGEGCFKQED